MQPVRQVDRPFTAFVSGQVTAPVAGAVIADTLQLAAGDYIVDAVLCIADTLAVGKRIDVELRDAGNFITIRILGSSPAGTTLMILTRRYPFLLNWRVRAIAPVAGAAGSVYTATIGVWSVP